MENHKAFIVTQTTSAGRHFYAVLAEDDDAAILVVDETFGLYGATYQARQLSEPAAYVASLMNPRKENK